MSRPSTRAAMAAVVAASCLLVTACGVGMPDSGPVRQTTTTGSGSDEQPANIDPPRPKPGASAVEIVSGFLEAMTATPPVRTSVARQFLTREASASWQPTGMVIYASVQSAHGNRDVEAKLTDATRTDARGAWLGPVPEGESTFHFSMAVEDDEWRISQPPPFLIVPQTWFEQRFRQVSLYFFDASTRVLVPEPVFVPRGSQFASTLVKGLLQGPPQRLAEQDAEQSYLPPGLRSTLSVPVSNGVARVDLTSDSEDVSLPNAEQSELLVSQLAWTLQQDPSVSRFQVTIDGRPVQLAGETEFDVEHGHGFAPYVAGSSTQLFGLRDGLMIGGSPQNLMPVAGPFGQPGYSLRSASTDLQADRVAAVSTSGSELWLAPVRDSGDPIPVVTGGEDLLRPAWDFQDRLWMVDRRRTGAVVSYRVKDRTRELVVPGISGQDVKRFLVSRDGTRMVAVLRHGPDDDSLVVSRILSDADGRVVEALPAAEIPDPGGGSGVIRDIAWRSPTSLVVLHPAGGSRFQVSSTSVDGTTDADSLTVTIADAVVGLVGTPAPDEQIFALAKGALNDLAGPRDGQIGIDPGVTMLGYVG